MRPGRPHADPPTEAAARAGRVDRSGLLPVLVTSVRHERLRVPMGAYCGSNARSRVVLRMTKKLEDRIEPGGWFSWSGR